MRRAFAASIALAGLALPALAQEGIELATRAKLLAPSASLPAAAANRQFLAPADVIAQAPPTAEILDRHLADLRRPRADCDITANDVCFDVRERKPVYRGVREYMPAVEGLKPESVSLKREGVVFKYSFK
jgi:hypothetical protein